LNHANPDAFSTNRHFGDCPLTGHIEDMAKSTKMTRTGHQLT
jgi:hypothetical protein